MHAIHNFRLYLYEAWQNIFKEYVALSRQENVEALK